MQNMQKEKWSEFFDVRSSYRTMLFLNYDPGLPGRPLPYPENMQARIDWALRRYEIMCDVCERIPDDRIPMLTPYTGTELFAEAFGSGVHYSGTGMPFALPRITCASEVSGLKVPDITAESLDRVFRIARALRESAGAEAMMQLPDIQSPFDIAALIWRKEDFFVALAEEPEAALELIYKVECLLDAFLDEWFREFGTEFIAHYPDFYMNGGITLSEDDVGSISPDMFRKFCLPSLSRLSERYGGIAMHCCAHSEHQWENFAAVPGLRLLNLNLPEAVMNRSFVFFADKVSLYPSCLMDEERLKKCLECAHVAVNMWAGNEEDAMRTWERMLAIRESRGH